MNETPQARLVAFGVAVSAELWAGVLAMQSHRAWCRRRSRGLPAAQGRKNVTYSTVPPRSGKSGSMI